MHAGLTVFPEDYTVPMDALAGAVVEATFKTQPCHQCFNVHLELLGGPL
jgi:hypothetical protein